MSLISMVGEAAGRVPKEVQAKHARIRWSDVIGMRNRVIHGYDIVDWDLVWGTVRKDFPPFVSELERALGQNPG